MDGVILVVEDMPGVRRVVTMQLEAAGHRVVAAGSVAEGIEVALDEPRAIAALVADLALPDGDGTALAQRVREIRPELRAVLYISGHPEARLGDAAELPPGHRLLAKPFRAHELLASLAEALRDADGRSTR